MASTFKKVVGTSAIGAISVLELMNLQQASASPANFSGSSVSYTPPANPGSAITPIPVQVQITVDGASGVYKITSISTPVQPGGANAIYGSISIPTLTSSALSAQSANVQSVSGATLISTAWKSSLSSAINAAAAAGQSIGMAVPAPTPGVTTPAQTPVVDTPAAVIPQTITVAPLGGGISAAVGSPLTYNSVDLPGYSLPISTSTFMDYLTQINNALADLNSKNSVSNNPAIINARSALTSLRAQVQAAQNLVQLNPTAVADYITNYNKSVNSQLQDLTTQANKAITDYNTQVQAAIDKLMADSKAAALVALPAPTPTVTVTVTVTVTPTPKTAPVAGSPLVKSAGLINKSFTCIKTVGGKTSTKIVTGLIAKCPAGFTLKK